ncbi:MAG: hypothetical protein JWQ38_3693 [Flavipsychrobacter sp.]|nr:hypothetical protein [Flavipsychrobacter sp.]
MNGSIYLKKLLLFCCCALICFPGIANTGHISLKRAMISKTISVNATSLGGYLGTKNLKLSLTNNTDKEMTVDIDPGLIFRPADTNYQDLVVMGNESIVLKPSGSEDISLQAFCGKSYARGPMKDMSYRFLKQGDSNMAKTLTYIKTNNIDVHVAQYAVWTFTNGFCLNTVYSHDHVRESEELIAYMAKLKKIKVPEYYMENKLEPTNGLPVIVAGQERVYATMHWGNEGYKHMYLVVLKQDGTRYKQIEADQVIDKYGYTVVVEFNPKVDPAGIYIVQLHDDNHKIWGQKVVTVGIRPCDMQ